MTRLALRVLPWVLVMTGCENWGVDGMARLEERYPERPEDTGPAPDVPTVDLGDVGGGGGTAGTWLLRVVLTGGMKVFADPSDIVQTDLFLVSISDGGGPALLTFCNQVTDVDLAGGMGETELSEETREAIGESPLAVGLDAEGLPAAQEIVWTWGLKDMVEPFTDPLPTEPSDPRVWDQDVDGNPGVTVHVLGPEGYRYLVRREVWTLGAGTASEDGLWISGTLTSRLDEGSVGASSPILETVAPITFSEDGGTWTMRRVGSGDGESGWDCPRLVEEYEGVFKDAP